MVTKSTIALAKKFSVLECEKTLRVAPAGGFLNSRISRFMVFSE